MIVDGVISFENLEFVPRGGGFLNTEEDITWSGSGGWTASVGGNATPPSPDAINVDGYPKAELTVGSDLCVVSFAGEIGMQVNDNGGSWPGINIFQDGSLAPQRQRADGVIGSAYGPYFNYDPGGVSWSSNGSWEVGFGTDGADEASFAERLLINPEPPIYPGMDTDDDTNDLLWLPAQVEAMSDYTIVFNAGSVHWMGTAVPSTGIGHFHYWFLIVKRFVIQQIEPIICFV